MATLTSQQLKDSYQSLVTIGDSITSNPTSGRLENGKGTPLTAVGINTDAPGNKIGIKTAVNTNERAINLYSGTTVAGNYVSIGSQYSETNANVNSEIRFGGENTGGAPSYLAFATGTSTSSTERLRIKSGGDISFRDGSASEAFYWDASAGSLGLGTTSPDKELDVQGNIRARNAGGASSAEIDITSGATWRLRSNPTSGTNSYGLDIIKGSAGTDVKMSIDSGGDISFRDGSANEAFYWDASEAFLGLGTVPSTPLHVNATNANACIINVTGTSPNYIFDVRDDNVSQFRVDSSGNVLVGKTATSGIATGNIEVSNSSSASLQIEGGTHEWSMLVSSSADALRFYQDSDERLRIDSSGTILGTGTYTASGSIKIFEAQRLGGAVASDWSYDDASTDMSLGTSTAHSFSLKTSNTNRLTIDSSGNVLVGKTTNSYGSVGSALGANGASNFTRDSDPPVGMNRLTSDGKILSFAKDSTEVGVIGTADGQLFIANEAGSVDAGLLFGEAGTTARAIIPSRAEGTVVDNALDLGYASGRFKDLYLSGSVYLGGTASANALDDYEEGTHQATITCGTSGTITLDATRDLLSYTKIGRLMTVTAELKVSAVSSPTGNFQISLPTTIASLSEKAGRSVGSITITNTSVNIDSFVARGFDGNDYITVVKGGSTSGTDDSADTFSGNEFITLTFTYVSA